MAMLTNRVSKLKASSDAAAAPYVKQAQALGLPMDQVFQQDAQPQGDGLTKQEQDELAALRKRFGR